METKPPQPVEATRPVEEQKTEPAEEQNIEDSEQEDTVRLQEKKELEKGDRLKEKGPDEQGVKDKKTKTQDDSEFQQQSKQGFDTKVPERFGHKININPEIARQKTGENEDAAQGLKKEFFKQFSREPNAKELKKLIQDRVLEKYTSLKEKMRAKLAEQQAREQGKSAREGSHEILQRADLGLLFQLRHQVQEQQILRQLLSHTIAKEKQLLEQRRVQAMKAKGDLSEKAETQKTNRTLLTADAAKLALARKLERSGAESRFETLLQRALSGGKTVPSLPAEIAARFGLKTDAEWQAFFRNVMNLNSAEMKTQGRLAEFLSGLFRGVFQKAGAGQTLVADFVFKGLGEQKFSQVPIDNALAEIFAKLNPGDPIPMEVMRNLGEDFVFLQLAHIVAQANLTEEQKQAILREFQKQMSTSSRTKLEMALMSARKKDDGKKKDPFAWAGDQFDKKERYLGKSQLVMLLIYSLVAVGATLGVYFLMKLL